MEKKDKPKPLDHEIKFKRRIDVGEVHGGNPKLPTFQKPPPPPPKKKE